MVSGGQLDFVARDWNELSQKKLKVIVNVTYVPLCQLVLSWNHIEGILDVTIVLKNMFTPNVTVTVITAIFVMMKIT